MKLHCPVCNALTPAANIDLQAGWGKCESCNEVFRLADVVPDFQASVTAAGSLSETRVERPFNAHATVERTRQELTVHSPAHGMRAGAWALLGFATFWLAFIAFWTAGALGVFFGQAGGGPQAFNILFACFSIPFWLIGFGMLGAVLWIARGTQTMRMDSVSKEMETETRCLVWSRRKRIGLDRVQCARAHQPTTASNGTSVTTSSGVEIVFEAGSYVIGTDSEDEKRWLMFEINDFLSMAL
jgi:hypothetical protein